jgi:hypothetical protein
VTQQEFYLSLCQLALKSAMELHREPFRQQYEAWRKLPAKKKKEWEPDIAAFCFTFEDTLEGMMSKYKEMPK